MSILKQAATVEIKPFIILPFFFRAFFNYTESKIGVKAKGKEFADFKAHFTPDDRGFGYIKIMVIIFLIVIIIMIIVVPDHHRHL